VSVALRPDRQVQIEAISGVESYEKVVFFF
jgi:hypothetical protein